MTVTRNSILINLRLKLLLLLWLAEHSATRCCSASESRAAGSKRGLTEACRRTPEAAGAGAAESGAGERCAAP
jgi:hypothetical protein